MADIYDNIDLFAQFADETQKAVEAEQNGKEESKVFYLANKHNSYKLRFSPVVETDSDTGRPKLVLSKTVWTHGGFEKMPKLPCKGRDCPICKEVSRLSDAGYKDAWKFKARKEHLARGYVYESNLPKEYKYLKHNEYGYIVLRDKEFRSLNAFLADLSPADMKKVLNPNVSAPRIKVVLTPGSDGSASWGFDIREAELPPVPDGFPGFDDVYVHESDEITEDHFKSIKTQVNKILASIDVGTTLDPDSQDQQEPEARKSQSESKEAAKNSVADALGSSKAKEEQTPICEGEAEGLSFGKNPQVLEGVPNPTCLVCSCEDKCMKATKA